MRLFSICLICILSLLVIFNRHFFFTCYLYNVCEKFEGLKPLFIFNRFSILQSINLSILVLQITYIFQLASRSTQSILSSISTLCPVIITHCPLLRSQKVSVEPNFCKLAKNIPDIVAITKARVSCKKDLFIRIYKVVIGQCKPTHIHGDMR